MFCLEKKRRLECLHSAVSHDSTKEGIIVRAVVHLDFTGTVIQILFCYKHQIQVKTDIFFSLTDNEQVSREKQTKR